MRISPLWKVLTAGAATAALALTAACGSGAGSANSSGSGTAQAGVLRIGTLNDAPPNVYLANGNYTGFDNELIRAVAAKVGLTAQFVGTDFSALLSQVNNGQFDVGSSAIATTAARKQTVDFSNAYNIEFMSLIAKSGSGISNTDALAGKRVAAVQSTVEDSYLQQHAANAQIVRFPNYDTAFAALRNGTVDAWLTDRPIAEKYLQNNANTGLVIATDIPENDTPDAFAVRKGNSALQDTLNRGLAQAIADGTWLKLHDQFLSGEPVPAQFRPTGQAGAGQGSTGSSPAASTTASTSGTS